MDIYILGPNERRPVVNLVRDVGSYHHRRGKVGLEEIAHELRRRHVRIADGRKAGPELRDQDQDVEEEADPATDDAGLGAEGELVQCVSL